MSLKPECLDVVKVKTSFSHWTDRRDHKEEIEVAVDLGEHFKRHMYLREEAVKYLEDAITLCKVSGNMNKMMVLRDVAKRNSFQINE